MTSAGVITNKLKSDYNGRVKVAIYDNLPTKWADIGTSGKTINNDGTPANFTSSNNYLVVAVAPTATDLNGSAICFDIKKLLSEYGAPAVDSSYNANLILNLCDSFDGTKFTYYMGSDSHNVSIGDSVSPQQFYFTLGSYSVTSVQDLASGMFPYIVGNYSGKANFATGASGTLAVTTPSSLVAYKHSMSWLMITILVLLLLVVFVVIGIVVKKIYKKYKRSSGGM